MFNFNPQQKPPLFPVIDQLETRVHGLAPYILAVCCAIGGYFWGASQDTVPVVLPVAVGFVLGLLLVPLLLKLLSGTLAALLIIAAALLTFWLLSNDAAIKRPHHARQATEQVAPSAPGSLL